MPRQSAAEKAGRDWAQYHLPIAGRVCAECEDRPANERHHWDGDPTNNDRNVVFVCGRCHRRLDGRNDIMGAIHRAKTHCPRGHPYEGDNLYVSPKGDRFCMTCQRERGRLKEQRRRAARRGAQLSQD